MKKYFLLFSLALSACPTLANTLHLALSNHTAELGYSAQNSKDTMSELSWLHHEDEGDLAGIGFYGVGTNKGIQGKVGGKLFYVDIDNTYSGQGLAIGGALSMKLGNSLCLEGNIHYAPSVTSFKKVEKLEQWGAQLIYEVMQNANVFVGYRNVDVELKDSHNNKEIELHQGGYVGLSIKF